MRNIHSKGRSYIYKWTHLIDNDWPIKYSSWISFVYHIYYGINARSCHVAWESFGILSKVEYWVQANAILIRRSVIPYKFMIFDFKRFSIQNPSIINKVVRYDATGNYSTKILLSSANSILLHISTVKLLCYNISAWLLFL